MLCYHYPNLMLCPVTSCYIMLLTGYIILIIILCDAILCFVTLAISRGMIEMASGILLTIAAIALVRAVPLFSDTPK